ncbi:MAG: ROK family protein [Paracoccaceae bacterium]
MRIGIDLGGTKIAGAILDADDNACGVARVAAPAKDYAATLKAISGLVETLEAKAGAVASSIGIGVPGSVDRKTGQITAGFQAGMHGKNIGIDLKAMLGRDVKVANDANCFALSEALSGAGVGGEVVFGAILGTGVGGGIVVNGKLLAGLNALGGEWGHIPLPEPRDDERPGPMCNCGKHGHIESWLSGPGFVADFARRAGIEVAHAPSPADIVKMIETDPVAEETLSRFEERLARALIPIIRTIDPDVIVLGGGLSNIDRIYETVPPLLKMHFKAFGLRTKIVRNMHGDSSGVRGAAWL